MLMKGETEHLICHSTKDHYNIEYHQIYEKNNMGKPIVIYINKNDMKISDELAEQMETYQYKEELCFLVQMLMDMEEKHKWI